MSRSTTTNDKAGETYWTAFWKSGTSLPKAIDLNGQLSDSYLPRQLDNYYKSVFSNTNNSEKRLLEVGCGNSVWLSYFRKYYGFQIFGLDYSEYGCEQTRKILERDQLEGTIVLGDLFNPPQELLGTFDVVCSFGVVEHFTNTVEVLKAIQRFLKPGGILITTVPNLNGPTGVLQKIFYKPVYDIHVVMDKSSISSSLKNAGLTVLQCDYYCTISFGVTLEQVGDQPIRFLTIKKIALKFFQVLGKLFLFIDDRLVKLPKKKYTSEGIFTVSIVSG